MDIRAVHLFAQEISQQAGRKVQPPALRAACGRPHGRLAHSHSIVAGGLEEMS
jgi:hypothetical protein